MRTKTKYEVVYGLVGRHDPQFFIHLMETVSSHRLLSRAYESNARMQARAHRDTGMNLDQHVIAVDPDGTLRWPTDEEEFNA